MSKTYYEIKGDDFYINGEKTYTELKNSNPKAHGLLFNARFIQGIFDDKNQDNRGVYDRFGKTFDPEQNTQALIEALPQWFECGLRAITIGMQGGGPICTYDDWTCINTGSFSPDGRSIDSDYLSRLEKVIRACDALGMLVIVSILYQAQEHLLNDGVALANAVRSTAAALCKMNYSNVIIEVANEYEVGNFDKHPLIFSGEGMATLIEIAREYSGRRFAVGSSPRGGVIHREVVAASDVILIHGNDLRREELSRYIRRVREIDASKPIVVNEDSPMVSQLRVSIDTHTSWGYYNNFTKQEPPCNWRITKGEDEYYAYRLAQCIGIDGFEPKEVFYLQGFEKELFIKPNKRYIRLASAYPEKIDYVEFYEDDTLLGISYDEPFLLYSLTTWEQRPYIMREGARQFTARVYMHDGTHLELKADLTKLK